MKSCSEKKLDQEVGIHNYFPSIPQSLSTKFVKQPSAAMAAQLKYKM
jgi:hypothetical protein